MLGIFLFLQKANTNMIVPDEKFFEKPIVNPRFLAKNYPELYQFLKKSYPSIKSISEALYMWRHKLDEPHKCPVCGKYTRFMGIKKGYSTCCSYKCSNNYDGRIQKQKESCIAKYGVDNPSKCEMIKEKRKETCIAKYGVDNPSKCEMIKKKISDVCFAKYGVKYFGQVPYIKEKIKSTFTKNHPGYASPLQLEHTKTSQKNSIKQHALNKYSNVIDVIDNNYICSCPHPECNKCTEKTYIIPSRCFFNRLHDHTEPCTTLQPIGDTSSSLELVIRRWLDDANIEYLTNVRDAIPPKELDIYIPSKKVAIEINGCYWHSDKEKPKNYHIDKFEVCRDNGIRLIQIWEDWLINKPEIVRSFLMSKLGYCTSTIYARKCELREVTNKDSIMFLNENHIQGRCNSKYSYGLFYNNELVSLMTFGHNRGCVGNMYSKKSVESEYELLRFCNKINTRVIGGASRLLKYFIETFRPSKIISYASCDISDGNLYKVLGFESDNKITRSYWYIDPRTLTRYHRSSFTKSKIVEKGIKEAKGSWTENEAMTEAGYIRIYDAGQTKWVKKIS